MRRKSFEGSELVDTHSQLFAEEERDWGSVCVHVCVCVHACVCVCVCVRARALSQSSPGCLRQALCQVRGKHSWFSCWAHLYDYTCLFKRLVS